MGTPDLTPGNPNSRTQQSQLCLLTSSADKRLIKHSLINGKKLTDYEPFEQTAEELHKNKIFSMDIASQHGLVLTGHDQTLTLSSIEGL